MYQINLVLQEILLLHGLVGLLTLQPQKKEKK